MKQIMFASHPPIIGYHILCIKLIKYLSEVLLTSMHISLDFSALNLLFLNYLELINEFKISNTFFIREKMFKI
jgi:hypothetical protein